MFHLVKLSEDQLEALQWAINNQGRMGDLIIGYDEFDQSIKWKNGYGIWSPPCKTEERR